MPRNNEYDEFDDDEFENESGNTPSGLRKALDKANKAKADLEKQLADLRKEVTSQRLSDLMRDRKVPANIQRWMKRDEVEATPEAVDKWLAENGEDFGWKPEAEKEPETPATKEPEVAPKVEQQSVLSQEDIEAYLRQQALGQEPNQAIPLDPVKAAVDNVAANIDINTDPAVVARMLQEAGIPIEGQLSF